MFNFLNPCFYPPAFLYNNSSAGFFWCQYPFQAITPRYQLNFQSYYVPYASYPHPNVFAPARQYHLPPSGPLTKTCMTASSAFSVPKEQMRKSTSAARGSAYGAPVREKPLISQPPTPQPTGRVIIEFPARVQATVDPERPVPKVASVETGDLGAVVPEVFDEHADPITIGHAYKDLQPELQNAMGRLNQFVLQYCKLYEQSKETKASDAVGVFSGMKALRAILGAFFHGEAVFYGDYNFISIVNAFCSDRLDRLEEINACFHSLSAYQFLKSMPEAETPVCAVQLKEVPRRELDEKHGCQFQDSACSYFGDGTPLYRNPQRIEKAAKKSRIIEALLYVQTWCASKGLKDTQLQERVAHWITLLRLERENKDVHLSDERLAKLHAFAEATEITSFGVDDTDRACSELLDMFQLEEGEERCYWEEKIDIALSRATRVAQLYCKPQKQRDPLTQKQPDLLTQYTYCIGVLFPSVTAAMECRPELELRELQEIHAHLERLQEPLVGEGGGSSGLESINQLDGLLKKYADRVLRFLSPAADKGCREHLHLLTLIASLIGSEGFFLLAPCLFAFFGKDRGSDDFTEEYRKMLEMFLTTFAFKLGRNYCTFIKRIGGIENALEGEKLRILTEFFFACSNCQDTQQQRNKWLRFLFSLKNELPGSYSSDIEEVLKRHILRCEYLVDCFQCAELLLQDPFKDSLESILNQEFDLEYPKLTDYCGDLTLKQSFLGLAPEAKATLILKIVGIRRQLAAEELTVEAAQAQLNSSN